MTIMTNGQFAGQIRSLKTQGGKVQDQVQALALDAIHHFMAKGQPQRMTTVLETVQGLRGQSANKLQDYFMAHCNIAWNKKTAAFKKKGKDIKVETPTVSWFDFAKEKKEPATPTGQKKFASAVKTATTGLEIGGWTDEQIKEANAAIAVLARLSGVEVKAKNETENKPLSAVGKETKAA